MVPLLDLFLALLALPRADKAAQLARQSSSILIDLENCRGKSGFRFSHADMLASLAVWTKHNDLQGRVTIVCDHGTQADSFWLPDRGYAVVFSGPLCKADDVLVTDSVPFYSRSAPTAVVTADRELIRRCHRAADGRHRLSIIPPLTLLTDLERLPMERPVVTGMDAPEYYDWQVALAAELLETESMLQKSALIKNKRRKALKYQSTQLASKLQLQAPDLLRRVRDIVQNGVMVESLEGLSNNEQEMLWQGWTKGQSVTSRVRERTRDRIVLAEQLRLALVQDYGTYQSQGELVVPPALAYVQARTDSSHEPVSATRDSMRLVVVSDTHGFESQLADVLPEGDVLLHLGDFAIEKEEGDVYKALGAFDDWLAEQPHPTKIVLRGNHDPRRAQFAASGALYVTRPTNLQIVGYTFALVPFMGSGLSNKSLPKSCDVLASHAPPRGLLDRCSNGQSAGSQVLLRGLERMKGGPPSLLVCGHIHEGRGAVRNVFCAKEETLLVNAANADAGRATRIEHGPVVIQLDPQGPAKRKLQATVVEMGGKYEFLNNLDTRFFSGSEEGLLLAVDLGLRTGVCLFDSEGRMLRYQYFHFESTEDLRVGADRLLQLWAAQAGRGITHIATEGTDPPIQDVWEQVACDRRLLNVKPEEWRNDLLLDTEAASGESSKAASRHIARQIIEDYGVMDSPDEEVQTDVAESLLLGLHVARRLGWIEREPAVRRYRNGLIVLSTDLVDKTNDERIQAAAFGYTESSSF